MLSTIHKAKGLENNRIFFLIPELIPSKFATMDWQYEQEENLRYVAITRAKRELIYVHTNTFLEDIKGKVFL
jgi:superfamily I DNA/RNA helicase